MTKARNPSVSVIITAFNEEKFIHRCLRSIFNQTLDPSFYEVIVVDDASSDDTRSILKQWGDDINLICNDFNLGLPASINKGISVSRGEYVIRLDADDYVNANYLNLLKLVLDIEDDIHAAACDYLEVDDFENVNSRVSAAQFPIGCGIMFRKSSMVEVGLYDETFRRCEEIEFRRRFEKKFKIAQLPIALYRYRKHENNMTNDKDLMDLYSEKLETEAESL